MNEVLMKRVRDILRYHDQFRSTVNRQLAHSEQVLARDMEQILDRVDIKSFDYSADRVQTSPVSDAAMVGVIAAREERLAQYQEEVKSAKLTLAQIQAVEDTIYCMDPEYRIVLLQLYYPASSYREAAVALGKSVSTVQRWHDAALEHLVEKIEVEKSHIFFE